VAKSAVQRIEDSKRRRIGGLSSIIPAR
jgi:hypothetical protein